MKTDRPHYFVWVDCLRGLAAISVLLWHYQHFYYINAGESSLADPSIQPFFRELHFVYLHGATAVQVFWMISGFVFASIYTTSTTSVKAGDFFVHRFARLYPLHFVTLIVVAILQFASMHTVGHYQIYPYNDLYHFVLNLGFASGWGLERGFSFNSPNWSVSVEILIYAVFFISIPYVSRQALLAPFIAAFFVLLAVLNFPEIEIWKCGADFFLGCFVFKLWQTLDPISSKLPLFAGIAGVTLGILVLSLGFEGHHQNTVEIIAKLIGFPSLVLVAASLDRLDVASLGSRTRFIGDLTYSTYLWHIPVQILTLIVIEGFAFDRGVVSSKWFFLTFFATVFGISHLSFTYLEGPSRVAIRNNFLTAKPRGHVLRGSLADPDHVPGVENPVKRDSP